MKNKGFTLIELLAVVLLLSLLALIVAPKVLEQKDKKTKEIEEGKKKVLYSDAETYIYDNINDYKIKEGNVYCIRVQTLIDEGATSVEADEVSNYFVKVAIDDNEKFNYDLVLNCKNIK